VKRRSSIDRDIEQIMLDMLERIVKHEETNHGNALSLLENFVTEQTPSTDVGLHTTTNNTTNSHHHHHHHHHQMFDSHAASVDNDDESLPILIEHDQSLDTNISIKAHESPLLSLEKMLSHPTTTTTMTTTTTTTTIESLSSGTIDHVGIRSTLVNQTAMTMKKKKFDKYRLFAEKMLRSTLS
jgi:hypothetical protein